MVQFEDASRIGDDQGAGSTDCRHLRIQKEHYLGDGTGDFICMDCKDVFSRKEAQAIRAAHQEKGKS